VADDRVASVSVDPAAGDRRFRRTPLHDASHKAVARARWVNELVGWVCGIPILAPYAGFRTPTIQSAIRTR
jgi:hypothetical protein